MDGSTHHPTNLVVTFEPSLDDRERDFVVNAIDQFNIAATGIPEWYPANFLVRDDRSTIVGGVLGYIWGGWLQITYLWIDERLRGQGYGTRLLAEAEAYGRSRGAIGAALETHSFQARPFYERQGYQLFSTLRDYPVGHSKFFLRKVLT